MVINPVHELIAATRYMDAHGLVWGNAGNASVRVANGLWISASGTMLGRLKAHQMVEVDLAAAPRDAALRPSKELPMHQAVYRVRPDVACIIHSSPFFATLVACTTDLPPSNLFVESMYYLYDIGSVEYIHPGTGKLAAAVEKQAMRTNVVLLRNHGVLVFDNTVNEALMRLETLETACRTWIYARASGVQLNHLSPDTVSDFIFNSGYKTTVPYGSAR